MTENQRKAEASLNTIREKIKSLQSIEQEIEALEYAAGGQGAIRYDKDRVQGGPSEDRMIIFVADALEKRVEKEKLQQEVEDITVECYSIIKRLENTDERVFLEWFYINCRDVEEIMSKINVSERNAYYVRERALEHYGELI